VLGINGGEFLLLIVVALVVVGPERLPRYAEQLGAWVRTARTYALSAKSRVTEELGEDVADVDWAALDPRRYDPRRIVREALLDDTPVSPRPSSSAAAAAGAASATSRYRAAPPRPEPGDATASGTAAGAAGAAGTDGSPDPAPAPAEAPFDDEAT
jgi:sec-independent protein translocase protein TatB